MSLLERIYYLHGRLQNNRFPNSGDLAREFEVSAATAHRDIAYLRDRLLAPLEFDQKKNGYFYTDSEFRLPFEDTPRLMLLLGLLQKMAEETGLTDLPELQKLQTKLKQLVHTDNRDIDDLIHCEWIETETVDSGIFTSILNGLIYRTKIKITYRSPAGNDSKRSIEPLKLVNYQGRWYILAWCHLRQSRRLFHLARITRCDQTSDKVQHQLSSNDDWLSGSFGIFKGTAAARYQAKIMFTGTAASIVRLQGWHPEQEIDETGDSLVLTLPVADDRELLMKVLQFGAQARILEPESLRQKAADEVQKMTRLYQKKIG